MREVPSIPVGLEPKLRNLLSAIRESLNSAITNINANSEGLNGIRQWIMPAIEANNDLTIFSQAQINAALESATGADGAAGINARAITLTTANQSFTYDTNGANPSPSSSVITATAVNTAGVVYYEFFVNDVSTGTATTTSTYTYTPKSAFTGMPDKLEVQIREVALDGAIVARDMMTMIGLRAGAHGITVMLSNEAHTLPKTTAGVVTYTGSGTKINVWEGTTALTEDSSSTYANSSFRVTASGTGITPGAVTGTGTTTLTYGDASAMTTDPAKIDFTIIAKRQDGTEITVTKQQSLSLSQQGGTGGTGARATFTTYAATGTLWTSGATYIAGQQIYYGLNWYTATAGTSGTVAPIHALGTVTATGGTATFAYATPPTWTANVDTVANTAITSMVGSGGVIIVGDEVTICWPNTTSPTYVLTKYASAVGSPATTATWTPRGQVIDGNLMVTGTLSAASLKTSNLTAANSLNIVDTSNVNRIKIGNLSPTAGTGGVGPYGIVGKRSTGTEVYRIDDNGLVAYPTLDTLHRFAASYGFPIIAEGHVTLTNLSAAGAITSDISLGHAPSGAIRIFAHVVGYYENSTFTSSSALSTTISQTMYYIDSTGKNGLVGTNNYIGADTTDPTNLVVSARISFGYDSVTDSIYLRLISRGSQPAGAWTYYRYMVWGCDDGYYNATWTNIAAGYNPSIYG